MIVSRFTRRLTTPFLFSHNVKYNPRLLYNKPGYYFSEDEKKKQQSGPKMSNDISFSDIWETVSQWG